MPADTDRLPSINIFSAPVSPARPVLRTRLHGPTYPTPVVVTSTGPPSHWEPSSMVLLYKPDLINHAVFEVYLRDYFPQVINKKTVMDAYWKWGAFSTSAPSGFATIYGSVPVVRVTDFLCKLEDHHYRTRYGAAPNKDEIWVNSKLVGQVESIRALKHPSFGPPTTDELRVFTMMESIIMYELVHWSHNLFDSKSQIEDDFEEFEASARSFLKDAYGGNLAPAFDDLCQ
jgi:hypothetical protein